MPSQTACLAHLSDADRDTYLAGLVAGADIDHRGTPFTEALLGQLLVPLHDPTTGKPDMGEARFDEAQFSGDARFDGARFSRPTRFEGAQFGGDAVFDMAHFGDYANFRKAQFSHLASFDRVQFFRNVSFGQAQFSSVAWFDEARFGGHARFGEVRFSSIGYFAAAQFDRMAGFGGAQFDGKADFGIARFATASRFGPLVCNDVVELSGAVFENPVTLEIAAPRVRCEGTRWESSVTARLRYATLDLSQAVLSAPAAVVYHPKHFANSRISAVDEDSLSGRCEGVRVASVQGVDAAHLVLTDTDLTDCLFSGAFHLDQLRLEGRTTLASTPTGWHRRGVLPIRWSHRRTIAEEHHWRAQTADQPARYSGTPVPSRQWRPGPHHPDRDLTPDPEDVAALYRQLRKAFEDGKNEPGAADFYYGECEMRRHDTTGTPKGERRLLWAYWLLSGYGLRASRATGWLLASMVITVLLLMRFGLPTHDPDPTTTGTLHGSKISLTTSSSDPALHGGWPERMTWARAEKATRVAVNSVVFRSSGQNLTTAGTYIEMTSRLLEPALLALAALAVRGRIKR
ncbi:pentapeptide repeat-containing protein [Streptomyces xylophagus]|uniref:pentapeptide repeat-containing protein n=1 Tax=Streptomyces xylophagus TaxID=285514 RepID=UPI002D219CA2|nr:pentapeptide repeat-containing protein [Streptomyces xylophagus]